jgi:hypothetical protein
MCNGVVVTEEFVADCGEIDVGYVGLLLAVGNLKPTIGYYFRSNENLSSFVSRK